MCLKTKCSLDAAIGGPRMGFSAHFRTYTLHEVIYDPFHCTLDGSITRSLQACYSFDEILGVAQLRHNFNFVRK